MLIRHFQVASPVTNIKELLILKETLLISETIHTYYF